MGLLSWALRPIAFKPPTVAVKGVCHLTRWNDDAATWSAKIALARRLGVTHCRGPAIEPWMDDPKVLRTLHAQLEALHANSITPLIEVGYGSRNDPAFNLVGEWRRFVGWVGREFPATAYGIGNEPDRQPWWTPAHYAEWLRVAADTLKAERDTAVVGPELGNCRDWRLEDVLGALEHAPPDVITCHPYGDTQQLRRVLAAAEKLKRPTWVTEEGSTSWWAPYHVWGSYAKFPELGVARTYWYAAYDPTLQSYNLIERGSSGWRLTRQGKAFTRIPLNDDA